MLHSKKSLKEQDAEYRAQIVGKNQVDIEKALIETGNGLFILFTPTQGTPQMISESHQVPAGLIPEARMESYDTSVRPRVDTTHQMPAVGINHLFIRHQTHRPHADNADRFVDETHYNALLQRHPERIIEKVIPANVFRTLAASYDLPAAFYYYISQGSETPEYAAIFGKQINSAQGNKLTDPGCYAMRRQDLDNVNQMLSALGYKSVESLYKLKDMSDNQIQLGSTMKDGQRKSARLNP